MAPLDTTMRKPVAGEAVVIEAVAFRALLVGLIGTPG
jgi:hypothetical protein